MIKLLSIFKKRKIKVTIIASDFTNVSYYDNTKCPLARSVKRALKIKEGIVSVGSYSILIDGERTYEVIDDGEYSCDKYAIDRIIAQKSKPNQIIRTLYIKSIK